MIAQLLSLLGPDIATRVSRLLAVVAAVNAAGAATGHAPDTQLTWQFVSGLLGVSLVASQARKVTPPAPPASAPMAVIDAIAVITKHEKSDVVQAVVRSVSQMTGDKSPESQAEVQAVLRALDTVVSARNSADPAGSVAWSIIGKLFADKT